MRVLVVEDHQVLGAAIGTGLRREGMAVDVVLDGEQALEYLTTTGYDVVVLDRDLPGISGDEVCRQLVTDRSPSRVLMLTAAGTVRERVHGLGLGADDYLPKPFDFAELVARVRALGRRVATAHVPLERPAQALDAIRRHAADPFVVGVRRNLQDEAPGFTEDPDLRAGIRLLGEAGLPFDACVRHHQLPELARLAAACPQTTFVLDHLGKPKAEAAGAWSKMLRAVAEQPNTVCKLSGLATELPSGAPPALALGLLREALEAFGPDRCLFGSDWPLLQLATDYRSWLDLVQEALAEYPPAAADAVLRGNAERVYRPAPSPKEAR